VTVNAPEAWQLACPGTSTIWVGPNDTMGALELPTQITGDHCDVQITCTPAKGTMLPVGVPTQVTCTARDPNGRMQTCTSTVTVQRDSTPPVLNCPQQITVFREFIDSAYVDYGVTATDNSGFVTLFFDPAIGTIFPLGDTPVTCTAVDRFGNTSTCTFTVTVLP
jgi:large repetitive protein